MLIYKHNYYSFFISFLFVLISILFSGLSSEIAFGLRAVDYLMVLSFVVFAIMGMNIKSEDAYSLLGLLFVVLIGYGVGEIKGNPFVMSDLRTYTSIFMGCLVVSQIKDRVDYSIISYSYWVSLLALLLLYFLSSKYLFVEAYYVPLENVIGKDVSEKKTFGPTVLLVVYMYIMMCYSKKQKLYFHIVFLMFLLVIYSFSLSRQILLIMILSNVVGFVFNYGYKRFFFLLVPLIVLGVYVAFFLGDDRLMRMVSPFGDSSFLYRVISNGYFISNYFESGIGNMIFGHGFGPKINVWMGSYIGMVSMVIFDNGVLTVLLKNGLIGFIILFMILYKKIILVEKKYWIGLLIPLAIASMLSAHIVTHFVYFFGFFMAVDFLKKRDFVK